MLNKKELKYSISNLDEKVHEWYSNLKEYDENEIKFKFNAMHEGIEKGVIGNFSIKVSDIVTSTMDIQIEEGKNCQKLKEYSESISQINLFTENTFPIKNVIFPEHKEIKYIKEYFSESDKNKLSLIYFLGRNKLNKDLVSNLLGFSSFFSSLIMKFDTELYNYQYVYNNEKFKVIEKKDKFMMLIELYG